MSSLSTINPARLSLILIISVSVLASCGHEPVRRNPVTDTNVGDSRPARQPPRQTIGAQAATVAVRQIGVPYRYGGSTVRGFDCSGLAQYAYAQVGKRIPRTTGEQWRKLSAVPKNKLQVGDLLFFKIDGSVSHVGLYLGKNRFVHAPSSGREVSIADLNSAFYRRAFIRGGRPN
jgi:cell wall-associated NlpC family hydrolase